MSAPRFWFDCEFIEDGKTIDLISIGIVSDDDRTLYLENSDCDRSRASEWVKRHVLSKLEPYDIVNEHLLPKKKIAARVAEFCGPRPGEFWTYFGDYDWVVFCQLFGTMMDLPNGWPMFAHDLKQLLHMVGDPRLEGLDEGRAHNALVDAIWLRDAWLAVTSLPTVSDFFRS